MSQVRSFLAVPLPKEVIEGARHLQRRLGRELPDIRWVKPEAMHLTLRFFGDIPEEYLEKIGKVMLSVGSLSSPFPLRVGGLGAFPLAARARVVWMGIDGGRALTELYEALERGLSAIGLPGENRPYSPHLTLGRSRGRPLDAAKALERHREAACEPVTVDRMVLFESRLHPSGPLHLPVKTVLLEKNAGEAG